MAKWLFLLSILIGVVYSKVILNILPRGYRLDLTPYPGDGVFKGRVRLDLIAYSEETDILLLHADPALNVLTREIKVIRVADLDSSEEEDGTSEEKTLQIKNVERNAEKEELIITLQQKIKRDVTYQIDITFDGTMANSPNTNRAFFQQPYHDPVTNEKKWIVGLNLKPGKARQVFPCMDTAMMKTWIELSVTHKTEFQVTSTMPKHDTVNFTKEGVFVTDHFQRTPPISPGSLALFMHDFQVPPVSYENVGIKSSVWGRPDFYTSLSKAHALLPNILLSLELYLSRPFPLPELNFVALPNFNDDTPIDTWGLMMFKESELMNGDSFWTTYKLVKYASSQWVTHLTTPGANASMFHDALQNFLGITVARQIEQPSFNAYLNNLQTLYLEYSKPFPPAPNSYIKRMMDTSKMQLLMHMLEHTFGTATFKAAIQTFLIKKEFKLYTDNDLWEILTHHVGKERKLAGIAPATRVEQVVQAWIWNDRLPLVTVTRDYEDKSATVTQEPYLQNPSSYSMYYNKSYTVDKQIESQNLWHIPMVVVSESRISEYENISEIVQWLEPQYKQKLYLKDKELNSSSFLIVNPASIGPFIVNYDLQNWGLISQKATTLPEPIRVQVLHDSISLALIGRLNYTVALNMTHMLRKEQEPTVWRTFYPLAEQMRKQFVGTCAGDVFDEYLRTLVQPVSDALGEVKVTESALKVDFRAKTRHILCATGSEPCVNEARKQFEQWLKEPTPDSGMPLSNSYLCTVFAWGTMEEWDFALERFMNFPVENRTQSEKIFLLKTLSGCPQNSSKLEKLLNLTLTNTTTNKLFTEEDIFIMLQSMGVQNTISHTIMFQFLESNWDTLKSNLSTNIWEYYIKIAFSQGTNQTTFDHITKVFESKKDTLNDKEKEIIALSIKYSEDKLKWSNENVAAIEQWLCETLSDPKFKQIQSFQFRDIIRKT